MAQIGYSVIKRKDLRVFIIMHVAGLMRNLWV